MRRASRAGLIVVMALAVSALSACETVRAALDSVGGRPTARISSAAIQGLTLDAATIGFDVDVTNPASLPLPLASLDYALASGGASLLTGTAPLDGVVPAGGTRRVTLPATIAFADALRALSGVRPGTTFPYEANLKLRVDVPAVGPIDLPLRTRGEIPVPAVPEVALAQVDWSELTLQRAAATLHIDVRNTNTFALDVTDLGTTLALGGRSVGDARMRSGLSLDPGQRSRVQVPIAFAPLELGLGLLDVLRGSAAPYALNGAISARTPYGPIELPFNASGETPLRR